MPVCKAGAGTAQKLPAGGLNCLPVHKPGEFDFTGSPSLGHNLRRLREFLANRI